MKFLIIFINGMEGGPASYKLGGKRRKDGTNRRRKDGRKNVTSLISLYVPLFRINNK